MAVQSHEQAVADAKAKSAKLAKEQRSPGKKKPALPHPTPQGLLREMQSRYATRFHMFLIIAASISMAVLTTRLMLSAGVTTMWIRYACALLFAYGTFFMGVWVWLHLSQYGRHLRADWGRRENWNGDPGLDVIPNINIGSGGGSSTPVELPFQGGGGSFDGGGAAGSWDIPAGGTNVSVDMPGSNVLSNVADIGDVGDEGGCAIVIAGILIAIALFVVFGATFYVVYQAPAILAEVVFEVLLGSPLARGARALDSANWPAVLLKKTWKPFAIMATAAMAFAIYCSYALPGISTAGQVLDALAK